MRKRLTNTVKSILRLERLSELSELNSEVNSRQEEIKGLKIDSKRLSDDVVRLERAHREKRNFWWNNQVTYRKFRIEI